MNFVGIMLDVHLTHLSLMQHFVIYSGIFLCFSLLGLLSICYTLFSFHLLFLDEVHFFVGVGLELCFLAFCQIRHKLLHFWIQVHRSDE